LAGRVDQDHATTIAWVGAVRSMFQSISIRLTKS
jgi:hypothetical protein